MLDSMHCEKTCQNLIPKNLGGKKSLTLSCMCEEEYLAVFISSYISEIDCVGLLAAKQYHLQ